MAGRRQAEMAGSVWEWWWEQGGGAGEEEQGQTPESLEDWIQGCQPHAGETGLFLEGKVSYVVWEEWKEIEGKIENWLEDDLGGLSGGGGGDKKSFFSLLRQERDISK